VLAKVGGAWAQPRRRVRSMEEGYPVAFRRAFV
jgi:hypothetical protein